jgi:hypothetical protein
MVLLRKSTMIMVKEGYGGGSRLERGWIAFSRQNNMFCSFLTTSMFCIISMVCFRSQVYRNPESCRNMNREPCVLAVTVATQRPFSSKAVAIYLGVSWAASLGTSSINAYIAMTNEHPLCEHFAKFTTLSLTTETGRTMEDLFGKSCCH